MTYKVSQKRWKTKCNNKKVLRCRVEIQNSVMVLYYKILNNWKIGMVQGGVGSKKLKFKKSQAKLNF
mgnify:CR=1 FL=1